MKSPLIYVEKIISMANVEGCTYLREPLTGNFKNMSIGFLQLQFQASEFLLIMNCSYKQYLKRINPGKVIKKQD